MASRADELHASCMVLGKEGLDSISAGWRKAIKIIHDLEAENAKLRAERDKLEKTNGIMRARWNAFRDEANYYQRLKTELDELKAQLEQADAEADADVRQRAVETLSRELERETQRADRLERERDDARRILRAFGGLQSGCEDHDGD